MTTLCLHGYEQHGTLKEEYLHISQKRANEKYNTKFHKINIRITPERHEIVKDQVTAMWKSTSVFINWA